jgi:hypothetical protein
LQRLLGVRRIARIALHGLAQAQAFEQQRRVAFGSSVFFRGIEPDQRIGKLLLGVDCQRKERDAQFRL